MNYWLISDTHFNHTKLESWGGRSGSWQQDLWNGLILLPRGDTLIHLGDICIGGDSEVHDQFTDATRGMRKILVRGNHDKRGLSWYLGHGWDVVADGIELIYEGHYLHFTHRPARPQGNNTFNIHGHTHGNLHRSEESRDFYDTAYHIDISPELIGYKPMRLDTLLKLKNRETPTT
jgi:calcineurin-like phosphoesterase family protein